MSMLHRIRAHAALALVVLAVFAASVPPRLADLGRMPPNLAGWTTAGTALFASHWLEEGPAALRFGMVWTPASIEQPTRASRVFYTSYPPGCIVPVYLIGWLSGRTPGPAMVMVWGLAVQAATALALAFAAQALARRAGAGAWAGAASGLAAGLAAVWLPGPYYEFYYGYFADPAAMPPFALLLWSEAARRAGDARRRWDAIQAGLLAWGMAAEWLFAFVAAAAFALRLAHGSWAPWGRRSLLRAAVYAAPAAAVLILFVAQLYALGALEATAGRFMERSGAQAVPAAESAAPWLRVVRALAAIDTSDFFWGTHMRSAFGAPVHAAMGLLLLCTGAGAALAAAARWRGRALHPGMGAAARVFVLALVPCLVYWKVFGNHSNNLFHTFTTLKFSAPIALLLSGVWPMALAAAAAGGRTPRWLRPAQGALALAALALTAGYAVHTAPLRARAAAAVRSADDAPARHFGPLVRAHAAKTDLVVSPDLEAAAAPPQGFEPVRRLVHRTPTAAAAAALLAPLGPAAGLCLVTGDAGAAALAPDWAALAAAATEHHTAGGFHLWRIPGAAVRGRPPA